MKVTLRKRKKNNNISLYLDIYHKGRRKCEYLRLYLVPKPRTPLERETNKETYELATKICAKRLLEMQSDVYGFVDTNRIPF